MRIAVTYENGQIFQHFGHTAQFKVYDVNEAGVITDANIHGNLIDVLSGEKPGRENDQEFIYFNAVGAGIMDIAVTARCYRAALEKGDGITLFFWE